MTLQIIGIGAAPNDGTGDNPRAAFQKVNANFNELYKVNTVQVLTDAATINWDASLGGYGKVTLGGNRTFAAPTNLVDGFQYHLEVVQDGTGSRTITWNAVFVWVGGVAPTLTTTLNKRDIFTFRCDNGKLYGSVSQNYV